MVLRCIGALLLLTLNIRAILAQELESLIEASGIQASRVKVDPSAAALFGRSMEAPLLRLIKEKPFKVEHFVNPLIATYLDLSLKSPVAPLSYMSLLFGESVLRDHKSKALDALIKESEDPVNLKDLLSVIKVPTKYRNLDLPQSLKQALYVILAAELNANFWVNYATQALSDDIVHNLWNPITVRSFETFKSDYKEIEAFIKYKSDVEQFKLAPMLIAAQEVARAVAWSVNHLKDLPPLEKRYEIPSAYGLIVLGSSGDDIHRYKQALYLVIDPGGDDLYAQAGASNPAKNPVSVALDLGGNDTYDSTKDKGPSFGAGVLGVGVLWDTSGNDRYAAQSESQAFSHFGVGVLVDQAGDDSYEADTFSQGSALAGISYLFDGGGNDSYRSFSGSQAFAGWRSASLLIDTSGNDLYEANDTSLRYPSSQDKKHNLSMSQGASSGYRGDHYDGVSLNGGVAFLIDGSGDDSYKAGVFAQGAGYWHGLGTLADLAGSDLYKAHWYAQGAAAHFAAGVLNDLSGSDTYQVSRQMGLGAGHDLSVGILLDSYGDDSYNASALTLGASSDAGIGIFLDRRGDDSYNLYALESLGWVPTLDLTNVRAGFEAYGLFFDPRGKERFTDQTAEQGFSDSLKHRLILSKRKLSAANDID